MRARELKDLLQGGASHFRAHVAQPPTSARRDEVVHADALDLRGHREGEDGAEVRDGLRGQGEPDSALDPRFPELAECVHGGSPRTLASAQPVVGRLGAVDADPDVGDAEVGKRAREPTVDEHAVRRERESQAAIGAVLE